MTEEEQAAIRDAIDEQNRIDLANLRGLRELPKRGSDSAALVRELNAIRLAQRVPMTILSDHATGSRNTMHHLVHGHRKSGGTVEVFSRLAWSLGYKLALVPLGEDNHA